ncbi:hypothetical protein D3C79_621480 [compost metagenome]
MDIERAFDIGEVGATLTSVLTALRDAYSTFGELFITVMIVGAPWGLRQAGHFRYSDSLSRLPLSYRTSDTFMLRRGVAPGLALA